MCFFPSTLSVFSYPPLPSYFLEVKMFMNVLLLQSTLGEGTLWVVYLRHTPSSSLHLVDKDMSFQSIMFSIILIENKLGRVVEYHEGMGSYKKFGLPRLDLRISGSQDV